MYVEPSDDEWEEMSSSDESEMCADGMSDTNSSLFSPLCLSAELHTILLNHSIPQQVAHYYTVCKTYNDMVFVCVTLVLQTLLVQWGGHKPHMLYSRLLWDICKTS